LWIQLKTANPTLAIKNWYGPTETTTYSSIIDLSSEFIPAIGVALAHEEIRVCNARLQEVPDGIEGELIIGGEGVALGYLNASGGFYIKDGTQYYRTGDFGSKSNGLIYLKGRTDRQVKRLGQRFELGEVEAGILKTFIQVSRVRYLVENHRFILFIEQPNTTHSIAEFKEFLLQKFPAYMRPDHILLLAAFPENSNGKIDDKKLLQLIESGMDREANRTDQSTELLKRLKEIQLFESLNSAYGFIEQGGEREDLNGVFSRY
jgi:non-ribosomal peptide synthetase component E (peptide arylation enzyme)